MPYRDLPATDASRTKALSAADKKLTGIQPSARLISAETAAALTIFIPKWEKEVSERADALGKQTAVTIALNAAGVKLRLVASHFFQVFQFGVARGIFSPSGRASYELSVNEETVPNLDSESDLLLWTDRIIKGDARRIANFGEPAMEMPTAAEVDAALSAYNTALALQTAAKDTLESEQSDVNLLRPEADKLIRDAWDEIEFSLRKLDPPTLRRRAREWGVFYALRPGEPEEPATETPATPTAP
jgi:hypothetical protein